MAAYKRFILKALYYCLIYNWYIIKGVYDRFIQIGLYYCYIYLFIEYISCAFPAQMHL